MKANNFIDAHLVKQFQSGNANALTKLVKRWHKEFCKKAYWIVKDTDLAKDIAQETWKTIIARIQDLKDASSFSGWAMRIVYSKSLDAIREINKTRLKQEEYAISQIQEETYQDNQQLKNELLKAIKNLSNQKQIVIRLFYVEDYTLREISELLKISVGTVKSRLFHSREKLKTILKNKDYEN